MEKHATNIIMKYYITSFYPAKFIDLGRLDFAKNACTKFFP